MRIIRYGDDPNQFVELYEPRSSDRGQAINDTVVLIHGGYWRNAYGLDLMHPLASALRRRGSTVLNLEYRRIGDVEDPAWPVMSNDILAGIDFAADLMPTLGGTLTVVGHSAGGQLALWAAARREVTTVVALAPLADLTAADAAHLSDDATSLLLGGTAEEIPHRYAEASPIARVPIHSRLIVVHGNHDKNVPIEQSLAFVRAAEAAGDDVTFLLDPDIDHFDVIDPDHAIWTTIVEAL